jgi:hypothetical protein
MAQVGASWRATDKILGKQNEGQTVNTWRVTVNKGIFDKTKILSNGPSRNQEPQTTRPKEEEKDKPGKNV